MFADPVSVRIYEDSDYAGVVSLWSLVFPDDPPWNDPVLVIGRKRATQPDLFWVAREGDRIIGTVMAGYDGVRGWIYHLAVHPSSQRKGTARRLMQAAEEALQAAGCPKINLQVRAGNAAAIDFYTVLGYRSEDRVSMGKPLQKADG